MKIGIVCYPTYGGSGVIASELGIELAKRGHHIYLISHQVPVRLTSTQKNIKFCKVNLFSYPLFSHPFYTLAVSSKIYHILKENLLDIIHVHYAIPHAPAALLAKQMFGNLGKNVRLVTTLHGTDIELLGIDISYKEITKYSLEQSDGITTVSHQLKISTIRKFNMDSEKIKVIYNFIDPKRFNNQGRTRHLNNNNDEKFIVHISNFRSVKRVLDTIAVLRRLKDKIVVRLFLVGDGPDKPILEDLVKEQNLESCVNFMGSIPDVQQILKMADLFLLTSEKESFGLSALEAMACGVPVVATNVGGLPEVVKDGECGYLVEVGNIEKMVEYALNILKDKELSIRLGNCGNKIAHEKFSIENIVSEYEKFYQQLI